MDETARNPGGKVGESVNSAHGQERSTADLVRDIITNVQGMVRSEVKLAKAEFREETTKTIGSVKKLAIAALMGLFALSFVLWSAAMLLALVIPLWGATLLLGAVLGGFAFLLYSNASGDLQVPIPEKTIENVKENVEWMKNQTKS